MNCLDKIRKSVISSLSRLFKHAGKVVISDNEIDDRDLQFINLMCRVSGGLRESIDFIVNYYKKYTGIEVLHTNDVEEQIGRLKQDIDNSLQFTCPCNTKKMADRLAMQLRQEYKDSPEVSSKIICITSEQGRFDAETVASEWSQSFGIYSPSITTGIDYNPDKPQTVYLFLDGENTVSPHTALQMIARNRNIKQVYICSTGMRNRPEWSSQEEMHASFDGLKGNLESMSILRDQFSDSTFDECTGMFKFTENRFTDLYKKDRWNDNMMRSSYMHNLDRLLEERGFNVVHPSLNEKLQQVQSMYDRTVTISTSSSSKKRISRARPRSMLMSRVAPRVGRRSRERFSDPMLLKAHACSLWADGWAEGEGAEVWADGKTKGFIKKARVRALPQATKSLGRRVRVVFLGS
jgi:hypothetical protein